MYVYIYTQFLFTLQGLDLPRGFPPAHPQIVRTKDSTRHGRIGVKIDESKKVLFTIFIIQNGVLTELFFIFKSVSNGILGSYLH